MTKSLRDESVRGIKNGNTQRKLLSEDRWFEQASQMALADEDTDAAKQNSSTRMATHTLAAQYCWGGGSKAEMLCKQLRILRTNVLETQTSSQLESAIDAMATMHIKIANDTNIIHPGNGKDISMVVDNGAGVSIINELTTMRTVSTDNPAKLQPADHTKLTNCTGQTIPVLGLLNLMTEYKGQSAQIPIVVVAGEMQNLLDRTLLTEFKLDWREIMLVRNLDPVHARLMTEVPHVFKECIGDVKDEATPRLHKARPVPHGHHFDHGFFRKGIGHVFTWAMPFRIMRPRVWPPICNEVLHLCQNRILSGVVGDGFREERQIENNVTVKHVHFTVNFDYALVSKPMGRRGRASALA